MAQKVPSIACIGIIGNANNPLHIALFPADDSKQPRNKLEFSFMLSSCLDIFEARLPSKSSGQDFGLLQAIDDRLAMYGWMTNTGAKFIIVVDMEGRLSTGPQSHLTSGLRTSDLTTAFQSIHKAYTNVFRNPFYDPEDQDPTISRPDRPLASPQIKSKLFLDEIDRIGRTWSSDSVYH